MVVSVLPQCCQGSPRTPGFPEMSHLRPPGEAGVAGGCELARLGAGIQTEVHWKSSNCCQLLSESPAYYFVCSVVLGLEFRASLLYGEQTV